MTRFFQLICHSTGGVTASLETADPNGYGYRYNPERERRIRVLMADMVMKQNIADLMKGEPLEMTRDPENAPTSEPMSRGRSGSWDVKSAMKRNRGQKRRTFRDN
jgi:hypothetical protein